MAVNGAGIANRLIIKFYNFAAPNKSYIVLLNNDFTSLI